MHFTPPQIILLALGILILYSGISGMSGTLLGAAFCIICIALCYRKWWVKKSTLN